MVFSSIPFLFMFLPVALGVYYLIPRRFQNFFILISALVFYAWGEPKYIFVMIFSILIDYIAGLVMDRFDNRRRIRKAALLTSVIMNILLLGLFKYGVFTVDNLNSFFGLDFNYPIFKVGSFEIPVRALPPIGLSFFTFQSMSYTIDLYKRNIKVQKSFINFSAFVTLFPQLVAGPIVRYSDISHELEHRRSSVWKKDGGLSLDMMYEGVLRFVTGLGKKVLIANNIGALWAQVKSMPDSELSVLTAWLGIIAFTFQIYFDFSGYSDMAIGLGKMLGFNFPRNFDYPYMSRSISEFWRRWHITLGAWFKSYVYFPLGGSRGGLLRTIRNLAVVWLLTGIWHGASWNFFLWGILYGIVIILEKLFLGKILKRLPALLCSGYTMLLVILGWVLFDTKNLTAAFSYIMKMFGNGKAIVLYDNTALYALQSYGIILLLCVFACTDLWKRAYSLIYKRIPVIFNYSVIIYISAVFIFVIAYLVNTGFNPFLYFNF